MNRRQLRVLVVDDSPLNRNEMVISVQNAGDAEVVGMAADGSEALRMATQLHPDVITLDLEMPKMDGFSFLRVIQNVWACPNCRNENRAALLGTVAFVTRESELETL